MALRADKPISQVEKRILIMMARGMTNREMGAITNHTEDGIKSINRAIFIKLKAVDRTNAVFIALKEGHIGYNTPLWLHEYTEKKAQWSR